MNDGWLGHNPGWSHRAESCLMAVESGNQQKKGMGARDSPSLLHIYLAYVAQAAGFVLAHSVQIHLSV